MSKKTGDVPQEYNDLIGSQQSFIGCLFSYKKEIELTEFTVLGVRRGSAKIIDFDKMKVLHLTYEMKLKNESMKRAQWTKPFPDMITDVKGIEI